MSFSEIYPEISNPKQIPTPTRAITLFELTPPLFF